jgi:hypothetical protein
MDPVHDQNDDFYTLPVLRAFHIGLRGDSQDATSVHNESRL